MSDHSVMDELKQKGIPSRAKASLWFFKTGKGQYGYGDVFFGVPVPAQRKIAKTHSDLPLPDIRRLLESPIHECRLTALFILVHRYKSGSEAERARIARFYLQNRKRINNWDLVDSSASWILGGHLLKRERGVLYRFARSRNVWERRIAIIATLRFIHDRHEYSDTLKLAEILLHDRHDLIQKAVGWMLREVGKQSRVTEEGFLQKYASVMPRTMLRYAIERFPETKRKKYLAMQKNEKSP